MKHQLGRLCCVLCPKHQFNSARNTFILIRHERFNKKPANLLLFLQDVWNSNLAVYFLRMFEQLFLFIYLLSFQLPGKKYAPGYNADVGDKHIWLKWTSLPARSPDERRSSRPLSI